MDVQSQVKITDVDSELKKMLTESKALGKVHACFFNLLVYTENGGKTSKFRKMLTSILRKFPCRVLFIQHEKQSSEDFLEVSVSSENFDEGKTSFSCDQITIKVGGKSIERVPYLVIPNFVPDLPIYLFWGKDPTLELQVLPYFEQYASRLMFDAQITKNLQEFSRKMIKKMDSLPCEIRDLNWGLTGPWRDVMAQVFNSADRITHLQEAKHLLIKYNLLENEFFEACGMQPIYFQAWLTARVGWVPQKVAVGHEDIIISYKTPCGMAEVILRSSISKMANAGTILNLEISGGTTTYHLSRIEAIQKVAVHIENNNECALPFTLPLPDLLHSSNFIREIFYAKTSQHYRTMLEQLAITNFSPVLRTCSKS